MGTADSDVIDELAGIEPGSRLDLIRARRPQARRNAQQRYRVLFKPEEGQEATARDITDEERHILAVFVAGLHRDPSIMRFYRCGIVDPAGRTADAVSEEVFRGVVRGPYGRYPDGPLRAEGSEGAVYRVSDGHRPFFGPRLCAALEHAHLLVFHPRDASPAALRALRDAGWSPTGIEAVSRIVSLLVFQIRAVAGLRVLDVA